uniref:ANK_REP_REGION domain-containing protein n=1 Tax=Macrostomum lignano TaxID=282301 RepID=A0A1I8IF15_9PLAT
SESSMSGCVPALYGRESTAGVLLDHAMATDAADRSRLLPLIDGDRHIDDCDADGNTALHLACQAGNLEAARYLLANGAGVNRENIDGATPLCDAAASGCSALVRLLLDRGAWISPRFALTGPAHEAAAAGHAAALQLLLDRGAAPDKFDGHLGAPLHYAAWHGRPAAALVLARSGARLDSPRDYRNPAPQAPASPPLAPPAPASFRSDTPLHLAVKANRPDEVCRLLAAGQWPGSRNAQRMTPLHLAALYNRPEAAAALLRSGANVDAGHLGCTALHIALRRDHAEVARVLLEFGANPTHLAPGAAAPTSSLAPAGRRCAKLLFDAEWEAGLNQPASLTRLSRLALWRYWRQLQQMAPDNPNRSTALFPDLTAYSIACCGFWQLPL